MHDKKKKFRKVKNVKALLKIFMLLARFGCV